MRPDKLGLSLPRAFRSFLIRSPYQSGLTLIELLIVILLIGVLGTLAFSRYSGRFEQSLVAQADVLRRNLAHAQTLAIGRSLRLKFTASVSQYQVEQCSNTACTSTTALTDPVTGRAFVVTLDNGAVVGNPGSFLIDNLGRPATATGLIGTSPAFTVQLVLSSKSRSVLVAPLTGFTLVQI